MSEPLPTFLDEHGPLALLRRIAGIVSPTPTTYHVTTRFWEKMVAEMESLPPETFLDPTRKPTRANLGDRMKFMSLTVVNSGTDSQAWCNRLNESEERKSQFREKHDRLALPAGLEREGGDRMKVFVGMPCSETIMTRTAICLTGLTVSPNIGALVLQMDTYCDRNHNLLAQGMLDMPDMDAILFVDSDQEFPVSALDRLVAHKRDIVGAAYRGRQPPHQMMPPNEDRTGLKEREWIPSGLMLVRRRVFETISFPWFPNISGKRPEDFVGSDVVFCRKARAAGFKIWCDYELSREVTHLATVPLTFEGSN